MEQIPGFPNYLITENGQIWSRRRKGTNGGWLIPEIDLSGYLYVRLYVNNQRHKRHIHHMVLKTYVESRPKGMECRHLNGNRIDNRLKNLCWGTKVENRQDSIRHGTFYMLGKRGEKCPNSKLSDEDRRLIFSVYHDGAYTQQELADRFNVGLTSIWKIVHDNYWRKNYATDAA